MALPVVALLAAPPVVEASFPGKNGRIAYMRKDANDHWQVWVASAQLTDAKMLTVEGADSGTIKVDGGDFSKAGKPLVFNNGARPESVKLRD